MSVPGHKLDKMFNPKTVVVVGDKGPGPLVTHFAAHNRLHVLVTIVPGAMTEDEIIAAA